MGFFEYIATAFTDAFNNPISDMTFFEILLVFIFIALALVLVVLFVKGLVIGAKFAKNLLKACSAKSKCKKIHCKYCGRNLLDCICQKNKGLSPRKRLKLYKKEQKNAKVSPTAAMSSKSARVASTSTSEKTTTSSSTTKTSHAPGVNVKITAQSSSSSSSSKSNETTATTEKKGKTQKLIFGKKKDE